MKKYLIIKIIEAEPMLQQEAEAKLGREFQNLGKSNEGYLICDTATLKWDWTPKRAFNAIPYEEPLERVSAISKIIEKWQSFFKDYNKLSPTDSDTRQQVYVINRHLKPLYTALCKILNIHLLKTTDL